MKKIYLLLSLAMTVMLGACTQDEIMDPTAQSSGERIIIKVGMEEEEPDARMIYQDEVPNFVWEMEDKLLAVGYDAQGMCVGQTYFAINSEPGTKYATFVGETVKEATHYTVYYLSKNLKVNPMSGSARIVYSRQEQGTYSSPAVKDYLLVRSDEKITDARLRSGFKMKMANAIFRFDVEKLPEVYKKGGDINAVRWMSINGESDPITCEMKYSSPTLPKNLWFIFDPQVMKLEKGGTIAVELAGVKTYRATAVSAEGKTYLPGHRYSATLSFTEGQGNISHWEEVKLQQPDDEIWVATAGDVKPSEGGFADYGAPVKVEGTKYWAYKWTKEGYDKGYRVSNNAFDGNKNLTEVLLPDRVTYVGNYSFSGCSNLKKLRWNKVNYVGESAFSGTGLESVTIPATLVKLNGSEVFRRCTSLKEVKFAPNGVLTEMGSWMFTDCTALTKVVIPETVEKIGDKCFLRCKELTDVTIPDNVIELGGSAFEGCEKLKNFKLPPYLAKWGSSVFSGCNAIESVVIPTNITVIPDGAFSYCKNLKSVKFHNRLTSIGGEAFTNTGITEINIPEGTQPLTIGNRCFMSCYDVLTINIPKNVVKIDAYALYSIYDMQTVNMDILYENASNLAANIFCTNTNTTLHVNKSWAGHLPKENELWGAYWKEIVADL